MSLAVLSDWSLAPLLSRSLLLLLAALRFLLSQVPSQERTHHSPLETSLSFSPSLPPSLAFSHFSTGEISEASRRPPLIWRQVLAAARVLWAESGGELSRRESGGKGPSRPSPRFFFPSCFSFAVGGLARYIKFVVFIFVLRNCP